MKHLYILLFVLPLIGFGQGWEQTFSGGQYNWGHDVQQTTDGGYIITGTTESFGDPDVFLIKTDEYGEEEWSQTFGGTFVDEGWSVQQTIDGGYIIGGSTTSFNPVTEMNGEIIGVSQMYLIKTDEYGEEEWNRTFGPDENVFSFVVPDVGPVSVLSTGSYGYSVQQTIDGGYVMCGKTQYQNNNPQIQEGIYIIKTTPNGNPQWSNIIQIQDEFSFIGTSIKETDDGGYIIGGNVDLYGIWSYTTCLVKIDQNGEEEWIQVFGDDNITLNEFFCEVQQTNEGGYISFSSFNYGPIPSIQLVKTDENGEEEWTQFIEGEYQFYDRTYSGKQTEDGGYIMCGRVRTNMYEDDKLIFLFQCYLLKTDENGNEEWSQKYGINGSMGYSVQQTSDEGYIICGTTYNSPSFEEPEIYLIKTDSEGNVETTSTIELPTPTSKRELVKTTTILGQENTTIKNQPMIEIYDDGSTEKKIVIE